MQLSAKDIASILGGTVEGDPQTCVKSFAKIEHGRQGQLCFYANPKYEDYVYTTEASILLVGRDFAPKQPLSCTLVRVDNAYEGVAKLLDHVAKSRRRYRRHRGWWSVIAFSARLGRKVWVGDQVHIASKCRIGEGTRIEDHVSVGEGCSIGKYCTIYPGVRIYPGAIIGDNVILHANCVIGSDGFGNVPQEDGTWTKIEHLGNVVIGDNVEIGACTCIDRAQMESTIIGDGVKIDNLCHIAHNVEIGANTVMAAECGIAGSTKIGKNCIIGGQVGIAGHLTIADGTSIGAQAGVMGNVRKSGEELFGTPAIGLKQYLRSYVIFKQSGK